MFHSWGLSIHMSWLGLTQTRISSRVCLKLRMCSSWVRVTVWLVKTLDHHAATLQNVAWKWDWHASAQLQRKSISTWLDTTSCPSTGNWNTNGCSLVWLSAAWSASWKSLTCSPARPAVHSGNTFSFYVRPLLPSLWPPAGAAPSCYPRVDRRGCHTLCIIRNAISGNRCRFFLNSCFKALQSAFHSLLFYRVSSRKSRTLKILPSSSAWWDAVIKFDSLQCGEVHLRVNQSLPDTPSFFSFRNDWGGKNEHEQKNFDLSLRHAWNQTWYALAGIIHMAAWFRILGIPHVDRSQR